MNVTNALSVAPEDPPPRLLTVGVAKVNFAVKDEEAAETVDVVPLPDGVTVKVYEEPLVRPATTQLDEDVPLIAVALETVQVKPPGEDVTV